MVIIGLIIAINYLTYIKSNSSDLMQKIKLLIFPIITLIIFLYIIITYETHFFVNACSMVLIANMAYCSGLLLVAYNQCNEFIDCLEKISVFYILPTLAYIVLFFESGGTNRNLGSIYYLTVGMYFFVPIAGLSINFIKKRKEKLYWFIPVKYSNVVRLLLILVYFYFIILQNGSRSPVYGIFFFIASLLLYAIPHKVFRKQKLALSVSTVIVMILFTIINPNSIFAQRNMIFIENLFAGNGFVTTTSGEMLDSSEIEQLVDAPSDLAITDNENSNENETTDSVVTDHNNQNYDDNYVDQDNLNNELELLADVRNRGTLFQLAVREAVDSFPFGLGPMGYQYKYGLYPHNAALEILSDFGLILGGIMILFIAYKLIKGIIISTKRVELMYIFMFMSIFIVSIMVSGSLYQCAPLFFGLGIMANMSKTNE